MSSSGGGKRERSADGGGRKGIRWLPPLRHDGGERGGKLQAGEQGPASSTRPPPPLPPAAGGGPANARLQALLAVSLTAPAAGQCHCCLPIPIASAGNKPLLFASSSSLPNAGAAAAFKRRPNQSHQPGCRDEQNLEENERIKKELNPRKIDEPKTPYLSPMDTDEEGDAGHRMRPLALDNPATAAAAAAAVAAAAEAGPAMGNGTSDEAGTSGASGSRGRGRHVRIGRAWSDSDRTVSPSPRHPEGGSGGSGRSPRFGDQYYGEHEGDDEEEEDGSADPQRQEKRRRFKEARKQHYNMREQLARARELMDAAESEDSEDLAAAEREQQVQQPQLEQRPSGEDGSFSEGHLDADVESEQEGAAGGAAAVRQRGIAGTAAAAAAAEGRGLVGHPLRSPEGHPLPSVSGHPLATPTVEGHRLTSPSAHPPGPSPAAHPLASPPGHPLIGDTMSD